MKYNIQFISSYGKIHEYNFIKEILPDSKIDIYSDTGYANFASDTVENYYKCHEITAFIAKSYESIRFSFIRRFLNLVSAIALILSSRRKDYDYCVIHFLSKRRAILSCLLPKKRKTILLTYGSDILRNNKLNSFFYRTMFDRAYKIVEISGNIQYKLGKVFQNKYKEKSVFIPFPYASFGILDHLLKNTSREDARAFFNLPQDKYVVVCGHTSTHDEQFEKLIPVLSSCSDSVLDGIHFVFPMTYGNGDYKEYREKIKQMLLSSKLHYTVLEEYMSYNDMVNLHIASDIHITTITTDALSFFLLEELYCGSILLYGSWLHYMELEFGKTNSISFESFEDLPQIIQTLFDNHLERKVNRVDEQNYIKKIQSPESIKNSWDTVLNP